MRRLVAMFLGTPKIFQNYVLPINIGNFFKKIQIDKNIYIYAALNDSFFVSFYYFFF